MPLSITRAFGQVKTEEVLALQILLDSLKHRIQIDVLRRRKGTRRVSGQEILPTGFFSQVTKALRGLSHCESTIPRLVKRQMYHVKRDVPVERGINDLGCS